MEQRILNYLRKTNTQHTNLGTILHLYATGTFQQLLSAHRATEIEFFPSLSKHNPNIQVYFRLGSMCAIIDFQEEWYEYCKYQPGCSAKELESSIIRKEYGPSFSLPSFLEEFIKSFGDIPHSALKTDTYEDSIERKKKKVYKIISIICFLIPVIVIGVLSIYCFITNESVSFGPYFVLVIIIPILVSYTFGSEAQK